MALALEVFNFDDPESWAKVLAVINSPLAVRALAAGMNVRCRDLEEEWTPELGPWQFSNRRNPNWRTLKTLSPKPESPNWYRIFGYPHVIAPWCAAIGRLIYPNHQWLVWFAPKHRCAAGIGFRDNRVKKRSIVIMDILRGQEALHKGTEWNLLRHLTGPRAFSLSIREAIR